MLFVSPQFLLTDGEIIITTPNHPFYTAAGDWVPAGKLRLGDAIRKADGRYGIVQASAFVYQPQSMYNLTVATAHTYFVGDGEWLVHNDNSCRKIAGTIGLDHSFDEHAAQWFGHSVKRSTHFDQWQKIVERAAASNEIFDWSTGSSETVAHLARIDGKYFAVQFFKSGDRAGELATAFVPNQRQITAMLRALGK